MSQFVAYRIDMKRMKEFERIEEAVRFFNVQEYNLLEIASGARGSHITGLKTKERWLFFKTSLPTIYIQKVVRDNKSSNIRFTRLHNQVKQIEQ